MMTRYLNISEPLCPACEKPLPNIASVYRSRNEYCGGTCSVEKDSTADDRPDFLEIGKYLLIKNRELYRRLARAHVVDEIAAIFFWMEDFYWHMVNKELAEYEDFAHARKVFLEHVEWANEEPWKDGKSCNVPMTCPHCVVEYYRNKSKKWLKSYE